ncbi:MAG: CHAT domain-containing protein [Bacteroidia bacterium]|nr:CHAT domain-containing protein [Bacteroidia bacterium]
MSRFLLPFLAAISWAQEAALHLGDSLAIRGWYAKADSIYEIALRNFTPSLSDSIDRARVVRWCRSAIYLSDRARVESLITVIRILPAPWTVEAFNLQGEWYYLQGKRSEAHRSWSEALREAQIRSYVSHPFVTNAWVGIGTLAMEEGKWKEADSLFQAAEEIRRTTLGQSHPDYGEILNQQALLAWQEGNFEKAQSLLQQLQEWYRIHQTEYSLGYLRAQISLGVLHQEGGQHNEAGHLLESAWLLDSSQSILPLPDKASLAQSLGLQYTYTKQRSKAETFLRVALALWEKSKGKGTPEYLASLNNLGFFYAQEQRKEEADALYLQCQQGWEQAEATTHPEYLRILGNRAVLMDEMGYPSEAERLYHLSRAGWLRTGGPTHPQFLLQTLNLAIFYQDNRRFQDHKPLIEEFGRYWQQAQLPTSAVSYQNFINSQAIIAAREKDSTRAESLYRLLTEPVLSGMLPLSAQRFIYISNYISFLISKAAFQQTDSLLNWLASIETKSPIEQIRTQALRAKRYIYAGDVERGILFYDSAHKAFKQKAPMTSERYSVGFALAAALWEVGKREMGFSLCLAEADSFWSFLQEVALGLSERTRMGRALQLQELLSLLMGMALSSGRPDWVDIALSRYTARIGFLFYTAERYRTLASKDSSTLRLYLQWRMYQRQLAQALLSGETPTPTEELRLRADSLETALSLSFGESVSLPNQIARSYFQNSLRPSEAVLLIVLAPDSIRSSRTHHYRYWAILLTSRGTWNVLPLATHQETRTSYLRYVERLYAQAPDPESYSFFWGPIQSALPRSVKRIYFVPAGLYHLIAIEGLAPEGQTFVGDRYEVRRKLRLDRWKKKNAPTRGSAAILLGDPLYGGGAGETRALPPGYRRTLMTGLEIPRLPGTAKEIECLQKSLSRNKQFATIHTFLGSDAEESALKKVNSIGYLHFATHGLFLENLYERDPLLNSGLLLTGCGDILPPEKAEDGIFTALEALGMNLQGCEAVVLSACESGLGHVVSGEGIYGLSRAFLEAGARRVLVSLWKVDDAATLTLMKYATQNGIPTVSSLRKAQQKLRRKSWKHPYFWAAFVWQE